MTKKICSLCGMVGHLPKDCPLRPPEEIMNDTLPLSNFKQVEQKMNGLCCTKCQGWGHYNHPHGWHIVTCEKCDGTGWVDNHPKRELVER